MEYPNLLPRFLKYVKVNSRSDEHSDRFPSTEREENFQKNVIMKDLEELGLSDVHYNQKSGCVIATIPSNVDYEVPTMGFDAMSRTGGNGVSAQVYAEYDPEALKATKVLINGRPLDDDRTYRIATIDYLAKGGDYLSGLREGTIIKEGDKWLYDEMIDWLTKGSGKGKAFGEGSAKQRMVAVKQND